MWGAFRDEITETKAVVKLSMLLLMTARSPRCSYWRLGCTRRFSTVSVFYLQRMMVGTPLVWRSRQEYEQGSEAVYCCGPPKEIHMPYLQYVLPLQSALSDGTPKSLYLCSPQRPDSFNKNTSFSFISSRSFTSGWFSKLKACWPPSTVGTTPLHRILNYSFLMSHF